MGSYCVLSDVIGVTGISGLNVNDVNPTLVNNAILDAETEVNRLTGNPTEINYETIIADGLQSIFDLEFSGGITKIIRVSHNNIVSMQPFPDDGSWIENNSSDWTATDVAISDDDTIVKDKDYSLEAIVSGGNTASLIYPSNQNLRLVFDTYTYFCFWIYVDDITKTFTVYLKRTATDYYEETFTVPSANTWVLIGLPMGDMTETGSISNSARGVTRELNYIEFSVSGAITFYLDGMCFVDKYVPVYDLGQIAWPDTDTRPAKGSVFKVSYEIDIFDTVPEDLKWAAAHLASATVWGWYAGQRSRKTGGVLRLDEGTVKQDKFYGFEHIIRRHRNLGLGKLERYIEGPEVLWTEEEDEEYG